MSDARDVIADLIAGHHDWIGMSDKASALSDAILSALTEAGYTVAKLEEADNYMDDEPVFRVAPDLPEGTEAERYWTAHAQNPDGDLPEGTQ